MKKFFRSPENLTGFVVSLVPTLFAVIFQPRLPVPFPVCILLIYIATISLWYAYTKHAEYKELFADSQRQRPFRIISFVDGRCVCEPSGILSHDSMVQFFAIENNCEKFICYGYVETIGQHGFAQIIPISDSSSELSVFNCLKMNSTNLVLRPLVVSKENFIYPNEEVAK